MAAGSGWERRSGRRKKNFRTSSKSIVCTSSSPTGWCHCHHDTTSASCRAEPEPRSVGALDRTPLPVGSLASEKSTIYTRFLFFSDVRIIARSSPCSIASSSSDKTVISDPSARTGIAQSHRHSVPQSPHGAKQRTQQHKVPTTVARTRATRSQRHTRRGRRI